MDSVWETNTDVETQGNSKQQGAITNTGPEMPKKVNTVILVREEQGQKRGSLERSVEKDRARIHSSARWRHWERRDRYGTSFFSCLPISFH